VGNSIGGGVRARSICKECDGVWEENEPYVLPFPSKKEHEEKEKEP
jgi:hypothetical protein